MQFGVLRSPKVMIAACLAIMLILAFLVKPPPAKTLVIKGIVAMLESDQQTGELKAMELSISEGEAEVLVNLDVPAAKTDPRPVFREGEAITIKVASPHVVSKVLVCDYMATVKAEP